MSYLLDTHTLLWALLDPGKLSKKVKLILEEPAHAVFISAVTFWEISLKYSLGKLDLQGIAADELPAVAAEAGFELLPLLPQEAAAYYKLEAGWHRDPFDRMLIRQAIDRGLTVISKDEQVARYRSSGLAVLW